MFISAQKDDVYVYVHERGKERNRKNKESGITNDEKGTGRGPFQRMCDSNPCLRVHSPSGYVHIREYRSSNPLTCKKFKNFLTIIKSKLFS